MDYKINCTFPKENTILIREIDDTYISGKYKIIICKNTDINKLFNIFNKYRETHNILIDKRLDICIIYLLLKYNDDIFIYDINNNVILNIYQYSIDKYNLNKNDLNLEFIKKINIVYLLFQFYFKNSCINWNLTLLLKYMKLDNSNYYFKLDFLINYLGRLSYEKIDSEKIKQLCKQIHKIFKYDGNEIKEFEKYSINEISSALILLKNNDFTIDLRNIMK